MIGIRLPVTTGAQHVLAARQTDKQLPQHALAAAAAAVDNNDNNNDDDDIDDTSPTKLACMPCIQKTGAFVL